MTTKRKDLDQIRKEGGGKVDLKKLKSFSEKDIERMAKEDDEDASFPKNAKPVRVVKPYEPAK